jgi:hypothetical protein
VSSGFFSATGSGTHEASPDWNLPRLDQVLGLASVLAAGLGHRGGGSGSDDGECIDCPVCQAVSAVRVAGPDAAETLAQGLESLAAVIRTGAMPDTSSSDRSAPRSAGGPPTGEGVAWARPVPTETIPVQP